MADLPLSPPAARLQRPRRWPFWLFAGLCLLVAVLSLRFLIAPLDLVMPQIALYLADGAPQALAHAVAGPVALALVPVQLSARMRARVPGLHRWAGYLGVLAMVVSGLAALAMLPWYRGSLWSGAGFAVLGSLWIWFALAGVAAARARRMAAHRAFMLRAASLTFGAVTLRLIMAPLMAAGWTVWETYEITAWACWLPNLIAVEWWLRREARRRG